MAGRRILVTGGTGCIGSALIDQLAGYRPARIASVTRGVTTIRRRHPQVDYLQGDIRDRAAMAETFGRFRPDIVFHLAALRDPGQAQAAPVQAITTNVHGTGVVLESALASGASQFVYASTGKAVRYYANEVYAATKLVGEAMVAAAGEQIGIGAARFTHVVDNSLILGKLKASMRAGTITLHDKYIGFYAQSAVESAQLLLLGLLNGSGAARLYSLADLGDYFELLDVALGLRRRTGSAAVLNITGFPPGYQSVPHPAQYDPATQGDAGPLFNALEAEHVQPVHHGAALALSVDSSGGRAITAEVEAIGLLAATGAPAAEFCRALDQAARQLTRHRFLTAGEHRLRRLRRLAAHRAGSGNAEHAVIDHALAQHPAVPVVPVLATSA